MTAGPPAPHAVLALRTAEPATEPSRALWGEAPRPPAPFFTTTPAPGARGTARVPGARGADRLAAAVTAVVLTAFGVLIVSGRVVTEGPVVLVLTRTHGVHLGDLGALAAWAAGVAVPLRRELGRVFRSRRRTTSGGATPRRG